MALNPLASLLKTCQYVLAGRVQLGRDQVGTEFVNERGQRFVVFRYLVVTPTAAQPTSPGAVFIPQFHVVGMSRRLNIAFSWLPIPFYIGLPGFRSKRWLVDPVTEDFAGYYEWDTVADAERYTRSFAAQFMTRRSAPGSVRFQVYPAESAPPPPR